MRELLRSAYGASARYCTVLQYSPSLYRVRPPTSASRSHVAHATQGTGYKRCYLRCPCRWRPWHRILAALHVSLPRCRSPHPHAHRDTQPDSGTTQLSISMRLCTDKIPCGLPSANQAFSPRSHPHIPMELHWRTHPGDDRPLTPMDAIPMVTSPCRHRARLVHGRHARSHRVAPPR